MRLHALHAHALYKLSRTCPLQLKQGLLVGQCEPRTAVIAYFTLCFIVMHQDTAKLGPRAISMQYALHGSVAALSAHARLDCTNSQTYTLKPWTYLPSNMTEQICLNYDDAHRHATKVTPANTLTKHTCAYCRTLSTPHALLASRKGCSGLASVPRGQKQAKTGRRYCMNAWHIGPRGNSARNTSGRPCTSSPGQRGKGVTQPAAPCPWAAASRPSPAPRPCLAQTRPQERSALPAATAHARGAPAGAVYAWVSNIRSKLSIRLLLLAQQISNDRAGHCAL